ncbi:hypothetical protein GIB67_036845 [Kingdonia uniflora]|uniref:Cytochrome P450 n=1 Tax=Kingdonia uniflora TaxID=39325 RepID=A0A7J7LWU7_9MAGN|nr:hypothetical protein GIB67_036845 [Kingdonia uniflora]
MYLLLWLSLLFVSLARLWSSFGGKKKKNVYPLPPGPMGVPILGNLHMLGSLPHRSLHKFAKKYGPIMFIRLGLVPTVVVSSPEAAELFLKTHDYNFASRPPVQSAKYLHYGNKGLAFSQYGPYWRNIRKLCTLELLTNLKVEMFKPMRTDAMGGLVESVKIAAEARDVVDLSAMTQTVLGDMTYRMLFRRGDRVEIESTIQEALRLTGLFNLGDYIPYVGTLDPQGINRRLKNVSKVIDKYLEQIIDEHMRDAHEKRSRNDMDFVDVMLSLMHSKDTENQYGLDRPNIKAILLDMLEGGMDTSATAIEWGFSEVMKHPRVLKRVQEELRSVVGMDRMVDEADISKLEYLNMVVKESMRLHPVGPLLAPHESMEDLTINGYHIPKKSRIIINAWVIGRDPRVWSENAEEFYPERFIGTNIDVRGHDFKLLPFGSGRRSCPAIQLALTVVTIVLAQMLHCFDWELPNGMLPEDLDMNEKFGLAVSRANPLLATPTFRLSIHRM